MVQSFRLEQPGRRRKVLLAFGNPAVTGERVQQDLVNAAVERRELEPLFQVPEDLVARCLPDEMFQDRDVPSTEAAALRREPGVEVRTAIDLHAVEKLTGEVPRQGEQFFLSRASRCPRSPRG